MRRYRGNMLLIELVITLLFFSLSMMVIMQVFATAQQKASDSRLVSRALMRATDVAERLSREEHPDALMKRLGFMGADGRYALSDEAGYDICVTLALQEQPAGMLRSATVEARQGERLLVALPSAYYVPKEASAP